MHLILLHTGLKAKDSKHKILRSNYLSKQAYLSGSLINIHGKFAFKGLVFPVREIATSDVGTQMPFCIRLVVLAIIPLCGHYIVLKT